MSFREKIDTDAVKVCLSKHEVDIHIDPVFLLNVEEWLSIAKKPEYVNESKPFDFEYKFGNNKPRAEIQEDGVVKYVCYFNNIYNQNLGPDNWIWMVKNCRNFITDSFHGNAFALIFKKSLTINDIFSFSKEGIYQGTLRRDNMLQLVGAKTENCKITNFDEVE